MRQLISKLKLWTPIIGILLVASVVTWNSCTDDMEGETFVVSSDLMIAAFMEQDARLTSFLAIVDKADFRGMFQAHGSYSCFIPTNDGVARYLQKIGKSSVDALTKEECQDIVKFHTLYIDVGDSLMSTNFIDGRLPLANMLGKYLTSRYVPHGTSVAIEINRQAIILEVDVYTGNGYLQIIDNVLIPAHMTVGEQILALSEDYSLYKSVMEKTGWTDFLTENNSPGEWYTAFVHSDLSYKAMGIENEDDLLEMLRSFRFDIGGANAPIPLTMTKEDSLLWNYAAYNVLEGLFYNVDLARMSSFLTNSPNQAMTFQLKGDVVVINEFFDQSTEQTEEGIPISKISEVTDLTCFNGVLIELDATLMDRGSFIGPQIRPPRAVYWDVCEQPEWIRHPNFRKGSIPVMDTRTMANLSFFNAQGEEIHNDRQLYMYAGTTFGDKNQYVNFDYMRYRTHDMAAIEWKLPVLTPGIYNFYVCYRRDGGDYGSRVRYVYKEEGESDQILATSGLYRNYSPRSVADMVNQGMKRYTARQRVNEHSAALLFGTIEVKSTGQHIMRLEVINRGTTSTDSFIDMFHFIPVDDEQFWPRFDMAGKMIWPDTPCDDIYPYNTPTLMCSTPVDY